MKTQLLTAWAMLWASLAWCQSADTAQQVIKGRQNSVEQQNKPYVILISVDGMRYDYARKYHARHLLALTKTGVQAKAMIPSYPSVTFPNHYTLVTGMYPSHHGLVGNRFYDRSFSQSYNTRGKTVTEGRWYGGTPLWVLAEQQQMLSASFYWVGSEAPVNYTLPTYYYKYNEQINIHDRIQIVVNWLKLPAEKRPHLITFYFPEVDHAGHNYGPASEQTRRQVVFIDSAVNEMSKAVKATGLSVNFVLVADHGMTDVDTVHPLTMPSIDTARFTVTAEGEIVQLYAKDTSAIMPTYKALKKQADGYKVFLRANTPTRWHYNQQNDRFNRIGDILLIPNPHRVFKFSNRKPNPGAHGYDPVLVKDMLATFYAWGPAFKTGLTIAPFKNTDVYPMVAQLLGLQISQPIDGSKNLGQQILKK